MSSARSIARIHPVLLGLWAYVAGYGAWLTLILGGQVTRGAANDALFLPRYFGAGLAALAASRSAGVGRRAGRGWRYVGGAWLASGLGAILWLANGWWPSGPLNWLAWGVYNLYYPLVLVGLWHMVELPIRGGDRLRLGMGGAILARQLLAFSRPVVPVVEELDLGTVVGDSRRTLRTVLPWSIAVRYHHPGEEVRVRLAAVYSGRPGPPAPGDEPWAPERTIVKPAPSELIGARVAEAIGRR